MKRSQPARIFQILLVAVCLTICVYGISRVFGPRSIELVPDRPLVVRVHENQKNVVRFHVESNQFYQVLVQDPRNEVSVTLSGPNHTNRSTGCVWGGVRISGVSIAATNYILELHSCDARTEGEYEVTLHGVRTAGDADHILIAAEQASEEAEHWRQGKPRKAEETLMYSKEALKQWLLVGEPLEEARAFLALGTLYLDLGDSANALQSLTQGLQIADAAHLDTECAALRRAMATFYSRDLKTVTKALGEAAMAREISQKNSSDRNGEAEGWIVEGDIQYIRGHLDLAEDAYKKAFPIFEALRYRRGQARTLWDMATVALDDKEFDIALNRATQARALYEDLNDEIGSAKSSVIIGHVFRSTNREQDALNLFEPAERILNQTGDRVEEALVLNSIASVHAALHRCDRAISYSNRAMEEFESAGNHAIKPFNLQFAGYCYYEMEDLAHAYSSLSQASLGFKQLENTRMEAFCQRDIALVQIANGDIKTAETNLNSVLKMDVTLKDPALEASVLLALGRIRENSNNPAALGLYQQALSLYRRAQNRHGEVSALYYIAKSLRRKGQNMEAVATSEDALRIIEKVRSSLASSGLRTYFFASARQHFDLYIDALMHMPGGMSGTNASRAFEASERARARTLLDSIGQSRVPVSKQVDQTLMNSERSTRAKIDARLEQLIDGETPPEKLTAINEELSRLNSEYEDLQGRLRTLDPRYAALVKPEPLTLSEIQHRVLDRNSILLEYALGEDSSYLFAVTDKSFTSFQLPKRSVIEKEVVAVRDLLIARSVSPEAEDYQARIQKADYEYPAAAAELSETLLGQVANQLGNRRLVIVADGALQYLPFAALPAPGAAPTASSSRFLVFDHEFTYLPSASTLAVIRHEAPLRTPAADRTIAVFADPVYELSDERLPETKRILASVQPKSNSAMPRSALPQNNLRRSGSYLPRLTSTAKEATAIRELVTNPRLRQIRLGFDATRDAALDSELRRFKFLHFATHTMLNDDHPELSSLELSRLDERGNSRSGSLRLQDIYNLRLSADLVVLSACETALGKDVKGEGLLSMVRGFMYSGTPRVLASLWKVDDDGTADLMREFYRQLLQSNSTAAKALQQAQITLMSRKTKNQPFYWAAFQLQGEWN